MLLCLQPGSRTFHRYPEIKVSIWTLFQETFPSLNRYSGPQTGQRGCMFPKNAEKDCTMVYHILHSQINLLRASEYFTSLSIRIKTHWYDVFNQRSTFKSLLVPLSPERRENPILLKQLVLSWVFCRTVFHVLSTGKNVLQELLWSIYFENFEFCRGETTPGQMIGSRSG